MLIKPWNILIWFNIVFLETNEPVNECELMMSHASSQKNRKWSLLLFSHKIVLRASNWSSDLVRKLLKVIDSIDEGQREMEIRIPDFLIRKRKSVNVRMNVRRVHTTLEILLLFYTKKNKYKREIERIRWPYSMRPSNSTNVSNVILDIFSSMFPLEYRERDA